MTTGLPIRPAPAACRISTASPILLHPSLITVFRVVPTLVSHENDSQKTRVSSLAGMEVEPSTWYSSRVTLPSTDPAHWRLTSQPCLCFNHHSPWAHLALYLLMTGGVFCILCNIIIPCSICVQSKLKQTFFEEMPSIICSVTQYKYVN